MRLNLLFIVLSLVGTVSSLPSVASNKPTTLTVSDVVRENHPCAADLTEYIRSKLISIGAFNGSARIDSLKNLVTALIASGVDADDAKAIGDLYLKFRNKEMPGSHLKRLAFWLDLFEMNPVPQGIPPIPGELRTIVCIPDLRCSISETPNNYSYYPTPIDIVLIAPAPKPGVKPQPYVNALLAGIAIAQGKSEFKEWLRAIDALRAKMPDINDPYADLFVKNSRQYSRSFEEIVAHLRGIVVAAEFILIEKPANEKELISRLQQGAIPEILHMELPHGREVMSAMGLKTARDVFPIAQEIIEQMEKTTQRARFSFN